MLICEGIYYRAWSPHLSKQKTPLSISSMHIELNFLEHILRVFLVGFATTNVFKVKWFFKISAN